MAATRTVRRGDGRTVAYCTWGPEDGAPVFSLHGRPGSRLVRDPEEEYERAGARVVTLDRPGYGESSRSSGRTIASGAADVLAVADELGIDRFAVSGVSAGGPYALATASVLSDRVTRCATIKSPGPIDAGFDFFAGMLDEGRADWLRFQDEGETAITEREYPETLAFIAALAEDVEFPEPARSMLVEAFTEGLRPGPWGVVDDYAAHLMPWGFSLGDIVCPVRVLVGRDDTSAPPAHGEWIAAHVREARLIVAEGGHFDRSVEEADLIPWLAGSDR